MIPAKRPSAAAGAEVEDGGAGDAKRPKQEESDQSSSQQVNLFDEIGAEIDAKSPKQERHEKSSSEEEVEEDNLVEELGAEIGDVNNDDQYERSHERRTWRGVLSSHADPKKRFKFIPPARSRTGIDVDGSCNWLSVTTALQAANRICGIEVGELSWQELHDLVGTDVQHRVTASLRVLKYRGVRTASDYSKGIFDGKRYKISQYFEFFNPVPWEKVGCALDRENIKAAIDNVLSKSVMVCTFPISENYFDFSDLQREHIYKYDPRYACTEDDGRVRTHVVVVTGFGFEEDIPYFEYQDCNGEGFGKKGYGRILPNSIQILFGFDILQD